MKKGALAWTMLCISLRCHADDFVLAPTPTISARTGTIYPFLIKQLGSPPAPTIRYQQVYSASLFTNVVPSSIYITTLTFFLGNSVIGWTVPAMQIDLSTTSRGPDGLSPVFSENVGPDDVATFGPGSYTFHGGSVVDRQLLLFDRPFRYDASRGNLLVDVRILDGSGFLDPVNPSPALEAYRSPTDQVSRIWATNVTASTATDADTLGLTTVIQLSPVPSLTAEFFPVYAGSLTNIIRIVWPSQPSVFVLQKTDRLGPNASWTGVTNQIFGSPTYGGRWIEIPASSAGSAGFFRLIWPGGYGAGEKTGANQEPNQPP